MTLNKLAFYYKTIFLITILSLLLSCSKPKLSYSEYTVIDTTYPEQEMLENSELITINKGNDQFIIHPKASYRVGAVVRGKRGYRDQMSKISPYDFVLVWGFLSDKYFYDQLSVSQGGRRYFFRPKRGSDLSIDWVYLHSSNNHLIPANDNIRRALRSVRKNDTIQLDGYLVNVNAQVKGRSLTWRSSLTRDDKGDGSCEIIYVKRVKINYRVYE